MKRIILISSLLFLLFSACKPDQNTPINPNPIAAKPSIPMVEGNYWIYQHVEVDSNGLETPKNLYDSIAVTPSSLFKVFRNGFPVQVFNPFDYPNAYNLVDSGSFFKMKVHNMYVLPKTSFPISFPDHFSISTSGDTFYVEKNRVSLINNPVLINGYRAVKLERQFPGKYAIRKTFHLEDIIVQDIGFYQFEITSFSQPYPKLRKKLIRYHIQPV